MFKNTKRNAESYRALVHYLKDQKAELYTYQLKENKPISVILRNFTKRLM